MSKKVIERLKQAFGDAVLQTHSQHGDDTALVDATRWKEIALFLRDDAKCAMDHFIDLTAVDYLDRRELRYEVVLHLRSTDKLHRVRLKAGVGVAPSGTPSEDADRPIIDTLSDVWAGANWFERECFDMFGIEFIGHPDMRRILMYPEFVGYPLRKDYPAQQTQPLVDYRPEALGKLPPFDDQEGMPFGRQTHAQEAGRRENALGFPED